MVCLLETPPKQQQVSATLYKKYKYKKYKKLKPHSWESDITVRDWSQTEFAARPQVARERKVRPRRGSTRPLAEAGPNFENLPLKIGRLSVNLALHRREIFKIL